MNIFVLDLDPVKAAQYHADKHVGKMILESAQLLCTTHHVLRSGFENIPYKETHKNHPCAKWIRESRGNYEWVCMLALELGEEFKKRFGKKHKSSTVIEWAIKNQPSKLKPQGLTNFALAMPDEYKSEVRGFGLNAVDSYRAYYVGDKLLDKNIVKYEKLGNVPNWFKDMSLVKRALELHKNHPDRKRIEDFLSGKPQEVKPQTLSIKKGDTVVIELLGNKVEGIITKYSSNNSIIVTINKANGEIVETLICKTDIINVVN